LSSGENPTPLLSFYNCFDIIGSERVLFRTRTDLPALSTTPVIPEVLVREALTVEDQILQKEI